MRIGILSAIPEEIQPFPELEKTQYRILETPLFKIKHPQHELFLIAGGLGKVNSAIASTLLIREHRIDFLINAGIAGSLDSGLDLEEVFYGNRLIQYDYGSLKEGEMHVYPAGSIPMGQERDPALTLPLWLEMQMQKEVFGIHPATILSGDIFLQCKLQREKLRERFQAHLVDMESAAVAQVSSRMKVPFLAIRAISDLVGEHSGRVPRGQLKKAAAASVKGVMKILEALPSEITAEP